jgi:hypothetical protein
VQVKGKEDATRLYELIAMEGTVNEASLALQGPVISENLSSLYIQHQPLPLNSSDIVHTLTQSSPVLHTASTTISTIHAPYSLSTATPTTTAPVNSSHSSPIDAPPIG